MQGLMGEPTPGPSRLLPGPSRVPLAPLEVNNLAAARRLSAPATASATTITAIRGPADAEAEASAPRPAGHDPHSGKYFLAI